MACILGSQYIPSIEYFAHWLYHDGIILEAHEHYQKRTWRNKTCIQGSTVPHPLTVPLQKGKHQQLNIQDVYIAYDEDWSTKHLRSIKTAYGKTGFAEEVLAGLEPILNHQYETLWSLNLACLEYVTTLLKGKWPLTLTEAFEPTIMEDMIDLRQGIPCGVPPFNGICPEYGQVLRINQTHQPNLSILDPLCHLGPGTYDYLAHYALKLYDKS